MKRRRTFLIVFVILVVVLLAGVGALAFMTRGGGGAAPEPVPGEGEVVQPEATVEVPTKSVVVVVQPVRAGMRIPPDAVELRQWRVDELPDDPVEDLNEVVGMFATTDLAVRQPIQASKVKKVVLEGADVALAIPQGKVAYAMPIRLLSTVANAIKPGARVDVLVSFSIVDVDQDTQIKFPVTLVGGDDCLAGCQPTGDQIPRIVAQYTVQNAVVLGVGIWSGERAGIEVVSPGEQPEPVVEVPDTEGEVEEAPPPEPAPLTLTDVTVVTLAISPQDALVLKWAWESESSVDLAMRSAVDIEDFAQPEAVTLQYMIDRFQISLPSKLPNIPENRFEYRILENVSQPVVEE